MEHSNVLAIPNNPKDRFIKIPIEKLLDKLPARYKDKQGKISFNESQWAMVEGLETKRFWVHISARRTGKSFAAAIIALAKLLEPGQYVTVVAPNFTLSSIIWDYVTEFIRELDIECVRFNVKDKVVQLVNGSVFRLLSANNRDSLIGRGAHLLIVDEAAIIDDDEYFTRDLRPALSTYEGSRALFISTPRGKSNYLYQYFLRGEPEFGSEYPDWGSARYTWKANPLLREKDIEEARKTLPNNIFQQEYFCEWTIFEGQIYELDEDVHLISTDSDPDDYDLSWDIIAGLDMGFRDHTAFVVIAVKGDTYRIVDHYTGSGSATSVHAELIQELINKWNIETIYIDAAAAQTKADLAYDYDIYCESAVKHSVLESIAYVQVLIQANNLEIHKNCEQVFIAMAAYRWNDKTEKQKPLHDWSSHYNDAVRYAMYSHSRSGVGIYGVR